MTARAYQFERVRLLLMERIAKGEYQAGAKLPTERALAKELRLSFHTIRHAMALLVTQGVIVRKVGRGTFVTPAAVRHRQRIKLALLYHNPGGSYAAEIFHRLQLMSEAHGVQLVMHSVLRWGAEASAALEQARSDGCRAAIIPWFDAAQHLSEVRSLIQGSEVPVAVAELIPGCEANCIEAPEIFGSGDHDAVRLSCAYLALLGYEHIAYLAPINLSPTVQRRLSAYTRYVAEHGRQNHAAVVGPRAEDMDCVVARWLALRESLAVVAYDDVHARRLITALHKARLRIPEDVAVMGFNDTEEAASTDPPLTSMADSYEYIAQSMLVHALALASAGSRQATTGARQRLVIRRSCGGVARFGQELAARVAALGIPAGVAIEPTP